MLTVLTISRCSPERLLDFFLFREKAPDLILCVGNKLHDGIITFFGRCFLEFLYHLPKLSPSGNLEDKIVFQNGDLCQRIPLDSCKTLKITHPPLLDTRCPALMAAQCLFFRGHCSHRR